MVKAQSQWRFTEDKWRDAVAKRNAFYERKSVLTRDGDKAQVGSQH